MTQPPALTLARDALAERLRDGYHSMTRIGHPMWRTLSDERRAPWLAAADAMFRELAASAAGPRAIGYEQKGGGLFYGCPGLAVEDGWRAICYIDEVPAASADAERLAHEAKLWIAQVAVAMQQRSQARTKVAVEVAEAFIDRLAALARPAPAGTAYIPHDYQGACPDDTQPDARDPECAACRAMGVAPATMANGLTEAETSATASVAGLSVSAQGDERAADGPWKCGNEFLPYHPSASHVEPGYRDGWNACYKAGQAARAQVAQGDEVDAWWWQPIETAPRDGTSILIADMTCLKPEPEKAHWGADSAKYGFRGGRAADWEGVDFTECTHVLGWYSDATHWMLLPAVPAARAQQGGQP